MLARLLKGRVDREEAALLLGLSDRSIRRLTARLLADGPRALAHGNLGRRPANAIDPAVAAKVVAFAKNGYSGLNDTHLGELLAERERIVLSRPTMRRILRGAGLESPRKRRAPRFRSRRARRTAEGMLVQLDGSPHRWFGPDGPAVALLGAIDDATSRVVGAVFGEQEDAAGYLTVISQVLTRHDVPLAAYSDRHSVFWIKPKAGENARGRTRPRAHADADRSGIRRTLCRDDLRQLAPGQGSCGAAVGHLPRSPGGGAAPGGDHGHRGCQRLPPGLPRAAQSGASPSRRRTSHPPGGRSRRA